MSGFLPERPEGDDKFRDIPPEQRRLMNYLVAFGLPKEAAFGRFYPEYTATGSLSVAGKTACRQFFELGRNREYMAAYRETLNRLIRQGAGVPSGTEVSETRKERVMKKFTNDVATSVETNTNTDAEVLKDQADLLKKVGYLKEEEAKAEPPRRYLPPTCSQCPYKIFIEDNVKKGNIEKTDD